jgi:hypothetical protein
MAGVRRRRPDNSQRTHSARATAQLLRPIACPDEVRFGDGQRVTDGSIPEVEHRQIVHLELPEAARLILGADGASRRGAPLSPDCRDVQRGVERPRIAGAMVSG